jgi:hypothetical protein
MGLFSRAKFRSDECSNGVHFGRAKQRGLTAFYTDETAFKRLGFIGRIMGMLVARKLLIHIFLVEWMASLLN